PRAPAPPAGWRPPPALVPSPSRPTPTRHCSRCRTCSPSLQRARRRRTTAACAGSSSSVSSQLSGMNSRQSTAADARSVTRCTLTPIWQFPVLPNAPLYIRATPGESTPSLGNPTSSMTNASGPMVTCAHSASRRRTPASSQVEGVVNCCNRCGSTPSRCAIGCIDLRCPSSINPRTYSSPVARWSRLGNPASICAANASKRGRTLIISSGVIPQAHHNHDEPNKALLDVWWKRVALILRKVARVPAGLLVHEASLPADLTGVGGEDTEDDPHGGGLAGAVGADEPEHLPLGHGERHVVERDEVAVAAGAGFAAPAPNDGTYSAPRSGLVLIRMGRSRVGARVGRRRVRGARRGCPGPTWSLWTG